MEMTIDQVSDLLLRMNASEVKLVEVNEGSDGRLQFYAIEVKKTKRPLKKNHKKED